MKIFNKRMLFVTLIIVGILFSVGHGLSKPQAVLNAYSGNNMYYNRWNASPQRYQRYWGSYYNNWQRPQPEVEVEKPEVEVEIPEVEVPEVEEVPTPAPKPNNPSLSYEQSRMLELVNEERVKAGANPLVFDAELSNVADVKAKDMVDNNYFSHESPTYGSPFNMMQSFGIKYTAAGENLAGYNSVDRAHAGLMGSDGHRKNILNQNYTHIGIGVQKSPRYGYVFVQMFIRK